MIKARVLAAFLASVFATAGYGSAQGRPSVSATPTAWLDPFCGVFARATQWNTATNAPSPTAASNAIILAFFAQSATTIDAHVTLMSDTEAYDVALHRVPVSESDYNRPSPTILVNLPKSTPIRYVYVDSYAADGGQETTCPSDPFGLAWSILPRPAAPNAATPRVAATFKQALPSLPCGKMFAYAKVVKPVQPIYPYRPYYDHSRTVEVQVFLDSNGNAIKTSIFKSSGDKDFDNAVIAAALRSKYTPEMLLCTPLVGEYLFRADFEH